MNSKSTRGIRLSVEGACVANVDDLKVRKLPVEWFMLRAPWGEVARPFVRVTLVGREYLVNLVTGGLYHPRIGMHMTCDTLSIDFSAEVKRGRKRKSERPEWSLREGLYSKRVADASPAG